MLCDFESGKRIFCSLWSFEFFLLRNWQLKTPQFPILFAVYLNDLIDGNRLWKVEQIQRNVICRWCRIYIQFTHRLEKDYETWKLNVWLQFYIQYKQIKNYDFFIPLRTYKSYEMFKYRKVKLEVIFFLSVNYMFLYPSNNFYPCQGCGLEWLKGHFRVLWPTSIINFFINNNKFGFILLRLYNNECCHLIHVW